MDNVQYKGPPVREQVVRLERGVQRPHVRGPVQGSGGRHRRGSNRMLWAGCRWQVEDDAEWQAAARMWLIESSPSLWSLSLCRRHEHGAGSGKPTTAGLAEVRGWLLAL